jgi:DNA-directed RNA polymerase specialized sigma24 family protein
MCYSVALALTRSPDRAEDLARYALTWAWRRRESLDEQKDLKRKLLTTLRERFLQCYRHKPRSLRDEAVLSDEDSVCIAQTAERNSE